MDESEGDHHRAAGLTSSFSQLLFSNSDHNHILCVDHHHHMAPVHDSFDHHPFSSPKMLCFEGYNHHSNSTLTCSDSSTSSTITTTTSATTTATVNVSTTSKSNRKRNGSGQETTVPSQRSSNKKSKKENPIPTAQPKARKEKLGERITALQQLVSPFGKTDTASVLHEAMGYIRFLHDQVQVLCSPYLQHLPEGEEESGGESRKELRSRGLCLVPVECTIHVASSNGADYWSPAMSSTKQ